MPALAVIDVVARFSDEGPASRFRLAICAVVFLSTIPVGLLMSRESLRRTWWAANGRRWLRGTWFVFYGDVGLATVLFSFTDPVLALHCSALYAVVGVHAGYFTSQTVVVMHIIISTLVIACWPHVRG